MSKILDVLSKGLLAELAPQLFGGMLAEALKKVTVKEASSWVTEDRSLWDMIPETRREQIKRYAPGIKNFNWLTPAWAISHIKTSNPAMASLLLGWSEGNDWIKRQTENLKTEIQK